MPLHLANTECRQLRPFMNAKSQYTYSACLFTCPWFI